jgi:transcriptional regulator with XRE-family HTH domain
MKYDEKLNTQIWDSFISADGVDKRYIGKQMDIAAQIDTYLKEKGWTQKQLAEKSGLRPSQLSQILSGNANPTLRTLTNLEEAIGADIIVFPEFYLESLENDGWSRPEKTLTISVNSFRNYVNVNEPSVTFDKNWGKPINVKSRQFESAKNASHHRPTG